MSTKGKTVFIVEDEESWAATLSARLGKKYAVQHYTTGEACLENLADGKPEIIVLDFHLEGQLTGLDTLKKIRKELPATKVIMFSAQDDVQIAVDTMDNGAYDYVVKGENAMQRLTIILRNLEEAEALRQQMIGLNLRFKREKFWLWMVIFGILIGSLLIYLNTCPQRRMIDWDPFGLEHSKDCSYLQDKIPE